MISVCMPLFNGEKYLRIQLDSILAQLGKEDEVVISDDGSTDRSIQIIEMLYDERVRVIRNHQKLGPTLNLQRALEVAKGDFIFLSDHDDLWFQDKVRKCLSALEESDLVLHDASIIDADGVKVFASLFAKRKVKRGFWKNWLRNSYTGCCMAFRRSVLLECLPFPEKIPMHDQWIGLVAERKFKVAFLPEALIGYRQHGANATNTVHGSHNTIWTRLFWRIHLLRAIVARL